MRSRRFEWTGAEGTAQALRAWGAEAAPEVDVAPIEREVREEGDAAVLRLTSRFDAPGADLGSLRVSPADAAAALAALDSDLRRSMEVAAANIRAVAEAQLGAERKVELPAGQKVTLREVAVSAAGIYSPGGRAAYPSSVLMCAIPAQVAGVERVALASPPGPDGHPHPLALAAAALCEVEEIYAMGGAQAIFALAYGTETIAPVDVIAGPGNAWVREAKRAVYGTVGIDSLAGPSELMVIAGHDTDPEWVALDLCAQAEHGPESPLVVAAVEEQVLDAIAEAAEAAAVTRPSVADAPLALVQVRDAEAAIDLANAYAPEHLELMERTPPCSRSEPGPPAASSSAATARPPSATTSPAPTTCCRPAAPVATRARSGPAPSAVASPTSRSTGPPLPSWPRTSTPWPGRRASPFTASQR